MARRLPQSILVGLNENDSEDDSLLHLTETDSTQEVSESPDSDVVRPLAMPSPPPNVQVVAPWTKEEVNEVKNEDEEEEGGEEEEEEPEAVDSVCYTGCQTSRKLRDLEEVRLNQSCTAYQKCLSLADDPMKRERFPLFSKTWCVRTMEAVIIQLCGDDIMDIVRHADILSYKLQEVVSIVSVGEDRQYAAVAKGQRWAHCSSLSSSQYVNEHTAAVPDFYNPNDIDTDDDAYFGADSRVQSCKACTRKTHRGGASRFIATSWPCSWDAENHVCGNSFGMPATAIGNYLDCNTLAEEGKQSTELPAYQSEWKPLAEKFATTLSQTEEGNHSSKLPAKGSEWKRLTQKYVTTWSDVVKYGKQRQQQSPPTQHTMKYTSLTGDDGRSLLQAKEQMQENGTRHETKRQGRNVALLIAYDYRGSSSYLKGTVPDVVRVFRHLTRERGYSPQDITIITDAQDVSHFRGKTSIYQVNRYSGTPTMFIEVLEKVIDTLEDGDTFMFQYSGHGNTKPDYGGDELDGLDEVLNTPNGEWVTDDAFYQRLIRIPQKVSVFIQIDACHSEGFSDLPFNYLSAHRIWCTDWAKPLRLPKAEITYVSGSQNYQTSADKGHGGALSLHAIKLWKKSNQMHKALDDVCLSLPTQDPSLAAYPTFRDTQLWSPYNPKQSVSRDPAKGGQQPNKRGEKMRVPSICKHGGVDRQGKSHRRHTNRYKAALSQFLVDTRLDSATTKLTAKVSGGKSRWEIVEGWQESTEQDLAPVQKPVSVVGTKCECAGRSPRSTTVGKTCGKELADGKFAKKDWCYVRGDSPCEDKQTSGLADPSDLQWSEQACEGKGSGAKPHTSHLTHLTGANQPTTKPAAKKCSCQGHNAPGFKWGGTCTNKALRPKYDGQVVKKKWCFVSKASCADAKKIPKQIAYWSREPCIAEHEPTKPQPTKPQPTKPTSTGASSSTIVWHENPLYGKTPSKPRPKPRPKPNTGTGMVWHTNPNYGKPSKPQSSQYHRPHAHTGGAVIYENPYYGKPQHHDYGYEDEYGDDMYEYDDGQYHQQPGTVIYTTYSGNHGHGGYYGGGHGGGHGGGQTYW